MLDDSQLPASLTAEWMEDEGNAEKPFPSFARVLAKRGTPEGESRYSWTVDFADRRVQARKEMQPHLDEAERIKAHIVILKEQLKAHKKDKAETSAIEALEQQIMDICSGSQLFSLSPAPPSRQF